MLRVAFVVVFAISGGVFSNKDCFRKESHKCDEFFHKELAENLENTWDEECRLRFQNNQCYYEASRNCGIEEEVIQANKQNDAYLEEACDPQSDIYKSITENRDCCIERSTEMDKICFQEEVFPEAVVNHVKDAASSISEYVSDHCIKDMLIDLCFAIQTRKMCGLEAEELEIYFSSHKRNGCPATFLKQFRDNAEFVREQIEEK